MSTIVYNMDCMEGMKEYPDKYFDLAIVDPPYGINIAVSGKVGGGLLHSPKVIRHSMIPTSRMPYTLLNLKE